MSPSLIKEGIKGWSTMAPSQCVKGLFVYPIKERLKTCPEVDQYNAPEEGMSLGTVIAGRFV